MTKSESENKPLHLHVYFPISIRSTKNTFTISHLHYYIPLINRRDCAVRTVSNGDKVFPLHSFFSSWHKRNARVTTKQNKISLIFTFHLALLVNHVLPCTLKTIKLLTRSCTLNADLATSESQDTKEERVSKSNCYLLFCKTQYFGTICFILEIQRNFNKGNTVDDFIR